MIKFKRVWLWALPMIAVALLSTMAIVHGQRMERSDQRRQMQMPQQPMRVTIIGKNVDLQQVMDEDMENDLYQENGNDQDVSLIRGQGTMGQNGATGWGQRDGAWDQRGQQWDRQNGTWDRRDQRWDQRDGTWDTRDRRDTWNGEWDTWDRRRDPRWDDRRDGWDTWNGTWDRRDQRWDQRDGTWDTRNGTWDRRDQRWDQRDGTWDTRDRRDQRRDQRDGTWDTRDRRDTWNGEWDTRNGTWDQRDQRWNDRRDGEWDTRNGTWDQRDQRWNDRRDGEWDTRNGTNQRDQRWNDRRDGEWDTRNDRTRRQDGADWSRIQYRNNQRRNNDGWNGFGDDQQMVLRAVRVTDEQGNPIRGMTGMVFFYIPNQQSEQLRTGMEDQWVSVTGIVYPEERLIAVEEVRQVERPRNGANGGEEQIVIEGRNMNICDYLEARQIDVECDAQADMYVLFVTRVIRADDQEMMNGRFDQQQQRQQRQQQQFNGRMGRGPMDMTGWTLHYVRDQQSEQLFTDEYDNRTVRVTGTVNPRKRLIRVESVQLVEEVQNGNGMQRQRR